MNYPSLNTTQIREDEAIEGETHFGPFVPSFDRLMRIFCSARDGLVGLYLEVFLLLGIYPSQLARRIGWISYQNRSLESREPSRLAGGVLLRKKSIPCAFSDMQSLLHSL